MDLLEALLTFFEVLTHFWPKMGTLTRTQKTRDVVSMSVRRLCDVLCLVGNGLKDAKNGNNNNNLDLIILYRKETYNIGNHFSKAIMINSVQLVLYVNAICGPIFSNIFSSRKMAALFVNIGEREKQKRKYTSLYKIFTIKFFKSYIATGNWRRRIITNWSHCKVTSLFISSTYANLCLLQIQTI